MSNVPTAAEIALHISYLAESPETSNIHFDTDRCKAILEEWAKQLQPKPDESDEDVVKELIDKHVHVVGGLENPRGVRFTVEWKEAEQLISRHTAAKVAQAEERGWNRGAEAARADDKALIRTQSDWDRVHNYPLPPYQKKGE